MRQHGYVGYRFPATDRKDAMVKKRFINPDALAKSPNYTHVVEVTGPCRMVYISGQLGVDRDGNVVGDFRAQARQVFENLTAALAAVGATFRDVVKVNTYVADLSHTAILREMRASYLNAVAMPASTSIAVPAFSWPGALLEVEAVAVLPLKAAEWPADLGQAFDQISPVSAQGPLAEGGPAPHLAEQGDVEPQGSVARTATING
jgi:enamine deaminase RidA (YjgF/YER057c/UK114 family)